MPLEQLFYIAQILAAVGVILSLGFIGVQIKANTAALERSQHNSTTAQLDGDSHGCRRAPRDRPAEDGAR